MQRGLLYDQYKKFYGKDTGPLIWKSSTVDMNPTVDKNVIAEQIKSDPSKYKSEYLSEFRGDIESYLGMDDIERISAKGVFSRPYDPRYKYHSFCDPSGGRVDSMTLGISHVEGEKIILDLILENKAPFSPESVVKRFAETLKAFRISTVNSDRYAGAWVQEAFRKTGIQVAYSKLSASDLYAAFIPGVINDKVIILDVKKLKLQLANLERRTGSGGNEIISHPAGSHDDLANVTAGACAVAAQARLNFPLRCLADFDSDDEIIRDTGLEEIDGKILYPERYKEDNKKDQDKELTEQDGKEKKATGRTFIGW